MNGGTLCCVASARSRPDTKIAEQMTFEKPATPFSTWVPTGVGYGGADCRAPSAPAARAASTNTASNIRRRAIVGLLGSECRQDTPVVHVLASKTFVVFDDVAVPAQARAFAHARHHPGP